MKNMFRLLLIASVSFQIQCASNSTGDSNQDNELTYSVPQQNDPAKMSAPYVVMVSIDGYRHDYTELHKAKNLAAIAASGVAAKSLKPVYPSKTFPNHVSIATGMYAENHGIVSNEFFDPERKEVYALSDRNAVSDGSWYLSEPIWNTIGKQGLMTASYFWVGSEAAIQGHYPNHYYLYDKAVPNEKRVDKVLEWLALPDDQRPHFITTYMSDVDSAGHDFGPKSSQVSEAVAAVDAQIGRLKQGIDILRAKGLAINLIIVSDHGMHDVSPKKLVRIEDPLLSSFQVVGVGPQMLIYLKEGQSPKNVDKLYTSLEKLSRKKGHFRVHRRSTMKSYHYAKSSRAGDIVLEADLGWSLVLPSTKKEMVGGNHGWHPDSQSMHGIFYAEGPGFKKSKKIPTLENVNIYPAILKVLGLEIPDGKDGKLDKIKAALK